MSFKVGYGWTAEYETILLDRMEMYFSQIDRYNYSTGYSKSEGWAQIKIGGIEHTKNGKTFGHSGCRFLTMSRDDRLIGTKYWITIEDILSKEKVTNPDCYSSLVEGGDVDHFHAYLVVVISFGRNAQDLVVDSVEQHYYNKELEKSAKGSVFTDMQDQDIYQGMKIKDVWSFFALLDKLSKHKTYKQPL
jgi:hypothetical protein